MNSTPALRARRRRGGRPSAPAWLTASALLALPLAALSSPELARKNNCVACHATESRLVGPAFLEVADKYRGQPEAPAAVASHIREGGSGRWGEMAMPAQPQLSAADAKRLATWILSLPGKPKGG